MNIVSLTCEICKNGSLACNGFQMEYPLLYNPAINQTKNEEIGINHPGEATGRVDKV